MHLPENYCPKCKKKLDAATSSTGDDPVPGDTTVCLYCSAVLSFGVKMELIYLTEEDIEKLPLPLRRGIERVRAAIRVTEGSQRRVYGN